jgi:hypothetical protein
MEGILVLSDLLTDEPKLAKFFDLPIYVDADEVYCFIRRQKRDVLERGRTWESVSDQYLATVHSAFLKHTLPVKQLPGVLVVTNNGTKESMNMLPIYVAIYNLSATVPIDINDTSALLAARLVSNPTTSDRLHPRLSITSTFQASPASTPTTASRNLALQGTEQPAPRKLSGGN